MYNRIQKSLTRMIELEQRFQSSKYFATWTNREAGMYSSWLIGVLSKNKFIV